MYRSGWVCDHSRAPLPDTGTVEVNDRLARFIRPGLVEEYSVNVDGVRQDFIVLQRPGGEGLLRVDLDVAGATVEPLMNGARLVLEGSGRKLNYNRLRATDATGKELTARLEVVTDGARRSRRFEARDTLRAGNSSEASEAGTLKRPEGRAPMFAVLVDDAEAVYPVRIDPTFSDANWISMGAFSGANGVVSAAVVDGSGNLYIGGYFTIVGDVVANHVAKWNGSVWTALGSGVDNNVKALAVAGTDLYVGGEFRTAGGNPANCVARSVSARC